MSAQVVQSALAPFLIIDMTKEHVQRGGVLKCLATRSVIYLYFFFFQAEDGIRDGTVTGVQTCALPISRVLQRSRLRPKGIRASGTRCRVSACDGDLADGAGEHDGGVCRLRESQSRQAQLRRLARQDRKSVV